MEKEFLSNIRDEESISDEERWNQRAQAFNDSFQKERSRLAERITDYIIHTKKLSGAHVLDIGGGVGRYSIPFAKKVEKVCIVDVSTEMLKFAKENHLIANINDIEYIQMDWKEESVENRGLIDSFDLVFSSMCRAATTYAGLDKMMKASRKWCSIHQFIRFEDSISQYLWNEYKIKKRNDPRQDKEIIINIMNYLWNKGYTPEIVYFEEVSTSKWTKDEMIRNAKYKYERFLKEHSLSLTDIVHNLATENGIVEDKKIKKSALISWCIE